MILDFLFSHSTNIITEIQESKKSVLAEKFVSVQTRDILESFTEVIRLPHIMQIPNKQNLNPSVSEKSTFLKCTS